MSALSHVMGHGRRLALLTIAVVVFVGAAAVFWATTGDTTSTPEPTPTRYTHPLDSHPNGPVTDAGSNPWEANNPGLTTSTP